jgi:hypothetical protein
MSFKTLETGLMSLSRAYRKYTKLIMIRPLIASFVVISNLSLLDILSSIGYLMENPMTTFQFEYLSMKRSYDPYHKSNVSARMNISFLK